MKGRILAAAAVCVLAAGAVPVSASAEGAVKTEGSFEFREFGDHAVITKYTDLHSTDVDIPDTLGGLPVKGIGGMAFSECKRLCYVHIPEGVTTLDHYAFLTCEKLDRVDIPESVRNIGSYVFEGTKWMEDTSAQDGTVMVNGIVIQTRRVKGNVRLRKAAVVLGSSAYTNNQELTSIVLPDGLERINNGALGGCHNLTAVTIPASVIYIETGAFQYSENVVISGYSGSRAERYAKTYGIPFKSIGNAPPSTLFSFGDVNRDGTVNSADASDVLKEYAGVSTGDIQMLSTAQCAAADVNSDGRIDAADASKILEFYSYVSTGGRLTMEKWLG